MERILFWGRKAPKKEPAPYFVKGDVYFQKVDCPSAI
jgi:hypothetical protein